MTLAEETVPVPAPAAAAVEIDGATVLLDKTTGSLHLLNHAGAEIWSRLDGSRSVRSIVEDLSEEFGAERSGVARDVREFVSRLAGLGLVESSAGLDSTCAAEPPSGRLGPPAAPDAALPAVETVWVDWYTAQVVEALRARGVEPILLKGPAIRRWLYIDAPGERGYLDADVLVPSGQLRAAAGVLSELGFRHEGDRGLEPASLWATGWRRDADGAAIDLHRTLHGCEHSTVDPWPVVRDGAVEEEVGGVRVLVPSIPVRAVQIVLVSPADRPWRRWDDLRRVLDRLSLEDWVEAAAVARRLGVERQFGYRLSQSPAGPEFARRLGLDPAPWWWLRFETDPLLRWLVLLGALPSWRARGRLARRLLLPTPDYVRFRDPEAAARGLAAAYGAWVAHVARLLPGAVLTALRSARRLRGRG